MSETLFNRRVNTQRLIDRSCESLIGICRGLLADEELNEKELRYLDVWLADCSDIASCWPGSVVHRRVREILHDGRVTAEELGQLQDVLEKLVGGTLEKSGGAATGLSIGLGLDESVDIVVPNRQFCFTGTFLFGPRRKCADAVTGLGGVVRDGLSKSLDYLVLGSIATETWAHSSFGRKVEQANELRACGSSLAIVAENQWVSAIDRFRSLANPRLA